MSAAMAAAAAAALKSRRNYSKRSSSGSSSMMIDSTYGHGGSTNQQYLFARQPTTTSSRYESQKQRDWNTFDQYRKNHKPVPLTLPKCSVEHVLDFLRCLDDDQFDETKQANWGSLDALVGRLRVAFEENGGRPARNPFGAPAVRSYLREVRDSQAKTRRDSLSG